MNSIKKQQRYQNRKRKGELDAQRSSDPALDVESTLHGLGDGAVICERALRKLE